jgi:hypothetical protein
MVLDVILALAYFTAVLVAGFLGGILPSMINHFRRDK